MLCATRDTTNKSIHLYLGILLYIYINIYLYSYWALRFVAILLNYLCFMDVIRQKCYPNTTDLAKIRSYEIENMKQQLNIYSRRVECLMKVNCQLQSELDKTVIIINCYKLQSNFIIRRYMR